jgi:hypothetical protein
MVGQILAMVSRLYSMRLPLPFPAVIFLVGKNISDVNTLGTIMNGSDQTDLVPADVEHG